MPATTLLTKWMTMATMHGPLFASEHAELTMALVPVQTFDELAAAHAAGRLAWPTVRLAFEPFAQLALQRQVSPADLAAHGADLYLACACTAGDTNALSAFEESFIKTMDAHLARCGVESEWLSEVRQKVRLKLFLGDHPGIRRYRAAGALSSFVRVTAVRVAVDVATSAAAMRQRPDQEILNLLVSMDASPEVDVARTLYRDRFVAAIEETLASLSKREKTIMRLHFVDGLNIESIGSIYRVHRATVARWLVAVRGKMLGELRKRLTLHLGGTPSELRSLVLLLRDDIDLSARRILGNTPSPT
jgi:RNA polymerase sigma-70 factor (ECF subfamily)